ncbi:MAG: MFS transporter [Nocardioides sp.]
MSTEVAPPRTGRWIEDWQPEDPGFWATTGKKVARRNLIWSIVAEHIGFSIWMFWSIAAAMLAKMGFDFSVEQLFILTAVPSGIGAFLRLPYTFAVPLFGGRNWTVISALLLLIPSIAFAVAVQNPATPYWVFIVISATAGFGGGNFASSMANINAFFPQKEKGFALGINAAGGNIGVAVLQLGLPIIVGAGGLWGLIAATDGGVTLGRVGYVYAVLALLAAAGAYLFMDNLTGARSTVKETAAVVKNKHTAIMSFLYIGTFGSFIGYSGAFGLVINSNFAGTLSDGSAYGINFAYYAFLGAGVGSLCRPFGGKIADRVGGAKVTVVVFALQVVGTLGIIASLRALESVPNASAGATDAQITAVVDANGAIFPIFLLTFLFVFAMTGFGNGSTFKMIPSIWKTEAVHATPLGGEDRIAALKRATVESSAVVGLVSAVGAFGGFLIPMMFAAPWVPASDKLDAIISAFWIFTGFYLACLVVTWTVYTRKASSIVVRAVHAQSAHI